MWADLLGEICVFCDKHGVDKSDIEPICNSFRKNVIKFEYKAYPDAKRVLHYFKEKGYEKPRKEIFEYAILNAGKPEIRYMIGDNPIADYEGGFKAGMIPILVHNTVEGMRCCEQLVDLLDMIQ